MPESETYKPEYGQITWLEIPVVSAQRAIAFYTAVLGWEVMNPDKGLPAPLPAIKAVHVFNKGKAIHGCFSVVEETQITKTWDADNAAKMSILPNFRVEHMEETLELVKANGGQILIPKREVGGNHGFFARFVDTEGNLLGLCSDD